MNSGTQSPRATVRDVATYLKERRPDLDRYALQNLLYYCKAWSLVWDAEPMFSEPFEAWINGPVCDSFWRSPNVPGNPNLLSKASRETADAVLTFYGTLTTEQLIELSHRERPWRDARIGLRAEEKSSMSIPDDAIRSYYFKASLPAKEFTEAYRRGVNLMLELDEDLVPEESDLRAANRDPAFEAWLDQVPGAQWPQSHL